MWLFAEITGRPLNTRVAGGAVKVRPRSGRTRERFCVRRAGVARARRSLADSRGGERCACSSRRQKRRQREDLSRPRRSPDTIAAYGGTLAAASSRQRRARARRASSRCASGIAVWQAGAVLIYSMGVSLDGYIAGPGGEFDWSAPDDD